jgi:hypothetical protein
MPLNTHSAQVLASSTKGAPIWEDITPRWVLKLLPWLPVEAGIFRVNQVTRATEVISEHVEGTRLPDSGAEYEANPKEIVLTTVQTVVQMHTRVPDLFNSPHDQLREQIRLAVEAIKERKEKLLVNSPTFGLLTVAAEKMRIQGTGQAPTPDDMDNLLSLVWKKPAFFLAHPLAIAALGRECNSRGLTLETVEMFGVPFITWRGVPIVPSDKLPIAMDERKVPVSSILLLRVGEQEQGVVGLQQRGVGDAALPSFSIRLMGIDQQAVARYLVTSYFSVAVLANDALGVLHGVTV